MSWNLCTGMIENCIIVNWLKHRVQNELSYQLIRKLPLSMPTQVGWCLAICVWNALLRKIWLHRSHLYWRGFICRTRMWDLIFFLSLMLVPHKRQANPKLHCLTLVDIRVSRSSSGTSKRWGQSMAKYHKEVNRMEWWLPRDARNWSSQNWWSTCRVEKGGRFNHC